MATVKLHRLARDELRWIVRDFERESWSKRARFLASFQNAVDRIAFNPFSGSPVFKGYRWVRTARFKYFLYYGIHDSNTVEVFAVAHGSRRPGYWLRRTRRP